MSDVFISFSHTDRAFVKKLYDALIEKKRTVWIDWRSIGHGENWLRAIYDGIEGADNFIFVSSPASLASEICMKELAHADDCRKPIILIKYGEHGTRTRLPKPLDHIQWIPFLDTDDFDTQFLKVDDLIRNGVEWKQQHKRLLVRANEWDRKKRDSSLLLRGNDLRAAEKWQSLAATGKEPQPTSLQRDYILASRKDTSTFWQITTGIMVLALVSIIYLAFAFFSQTAVTANAKETARAEATLRAEADATARVEADMRATSVWQSIQSADAQKTAEAEAIKSKEEEEKQAKIALSRGLAKSAVAQLSVDRELATLLAIEAVNTTHTFEAEDALRQALSGVRRVALHGHTDKISAAMFSPDSQKIFTINDDNTASVWYVPAGLELFILSQPASMIKDSLFSPDSSKLATTYDDHTIGIWNVLTGQEIFVLRGHSDTLSCISFSPDGTYLVTCSKDASARVWDTSTGKSVTNLPGSLAKFSPDGIRIVTFGTAQPPIIWDTRTRHQVATLQGHEFGVSHLDFSPDGRQIVTVGWTDVRVWDANTGKQQFLLTGHGGSVTFAFFSPDGKKIITHSTDGYARLWDASTGKEKYQ